MNVKQDNDKKLQEELDETVQTKDYSKLIAFDFAIKFLLRHKANYDILEAFLSALLKERGYSPVKILAVLDTESNKEQYSQKKSLADLIVEDDQKHKYIIEIERQQVKYFVHKACFNTSRLVVDQVSSGEDFIRIKKIFHISLLYFDIGESPIYHGKTVFYGDDENDKLSVHITDDYHNTFDAVDVLPEYILISIPMFNNAVKSDLDEWLYVMKNSKVEPTFKGPCMNKVAQRLSILRMTEEERDEYYKYIKDVATYKDAVDTAESKGREKGKAEGKAEEKIEIAKNMLQKKVDITLISEVTGLSEAEIKKLKP